MTERHKFSAPPPPKNEGIHKIKCMVVNKEGTTLQYHLIVCDGKHASNTFKVIIKLILYYFLQEIH